MKLYAFHPSGHGSMSFFVMAESEEAARAAIDDHVRPSRKGPIPCQYSGWGTPEYKLTVVKAGVVVENEND